MVVDLDRFNQYVNNFDETPDVVKEKEGFLISAQSIVEDYLGYQVESRTYDDKLSGIGSERLYLRARPVSYLRSVIINGAEHMPSEFDLRDDYIISKTGLPVFIEGINNIAVSYDAGWTTVPEIIISSILRIAGLLYTEARGNIGITGLSMGDNSRTFINYTNFDKYLSPLKSWRVLIG